MSTSTKRNKQEMTHLFILREDKISKKNGCAPLGCQITISGKDGYIPTNLKIPYEHFCQVNKTLHTTCPNYDELQSDIKDFLSDINAYFSVLKIEYDYVTPQMVKNRYEGKPDHHTGQELNTTDQSLLKTADSFVKDFEKKVNEGKKSKETLKQWKATRNKLIEFLTYKKTKKAPFIPNYKSEKEREEYLKDGKKYDVQLSTVRPKFSDEFRTYLTVDRNGVLQDAAADKQLKNTKQLFKYAVTKEWIQRNPLIDFRCTAKEKDVIPLDFWEINELYHKKGLSPKLERIRDAFVFMIFTGFAFQDIKALSPEHIFVEPLSGELYISKKRGKTNVEEMVPVLPPIAELLEKYKNHPYCIEKNVLIPIISNSCFNEYLKELAAICNISKVLKTHLARHTFAHIMLSYGVPLEVLSKMMGHRSIRTTQRYCRVSIQLIMDKVKPVRNKMFNKMGELKFFKKFSMKQTVTAMAA